MIKRLFLLPAVMLAVSLRPAAVASVGDAWLNPAPPAVTNRNVKIAGNFPKPNGDERFNAIPPGAEAVSAPMPESPSSRPPAHPVADTRAAHTADTNLVAVSDTNLPVSMTATAGQTTDSLDDRQKLGPGDQLLYQVLEDQDPPQTLTVSDSGDLSVPYYGLVHAAGKTCRQLAGEVKSLLQQKLYYQATVIIDLALANKALVTGKVYVTGQVRQPGGYAIPAAENLTVSKAILEAGGFSDFSDKKHVRLIRKTADGEKTSIVNVLDVWNGQLNQDLPVQPGDTVVVPARLVNY